jgi:hypothetical protein
MSLFQVKLTEGIGRTSQGYLDTIAQTTGFSIQRTMYCMGPNKTNRKLVDGATFTDVNYWKRFSYPTLPYDQAFIVVLQDDGSVWNDFEPENTFPVSYTLTVAPGSAYAANVINVLQENGSPAVFAQITVTTGGSAPTFMINGLSTATLSIPGGTTQVFDNGDLEITQLAVNNTQSGNSTVTVDVLFSILSIAQS